MNFTWLQAFGSGTVAGAVAWWIILAFVFGWTSPTTAQRQAEAQTDAAVVAALAPVCAANFKAQPDVLEKTKALANASSWSRRDIIPDEWVTMPGDNYPDAELVAECSKLVLQSAPKKAAAEEAL
jgi:hypothetical protein